MPGSRLLKCRGCAGVLCECWWAEIKGFPEEIPSWDAAAVESKGFFPSSLTTSRGQNAQIQAETACWRQQGCLPRDFDACLINGKGNPTGKDLQKCLRASPCIGAGSLILNDRRLSKPIFKKPLRSTIRKNSASVPVLCFCWFSCYSGMGKKNTNQPQRRENKIWYTESHYCTSV